MRVQRLGSRSFGYGRGRRGCKKTKRTANIRLLVALFVSFVGLSLPVGPSVVPFVGLSVGPLVGPLVGRSLGGFSGCFR